MFMNRFKNNLGDNIGRIDEFKVILDQLELDKYYCNSGDNQTIKMMETNSEEDRYHKMKNQ